MLYNFIRKPTVAILYKGETLKRLLDQRWTGHLATVKVVVKSFHNIATLLIEMENTRGLGAEVRIEATGLLCAVTQRSFLFIAHLVMKLLSLFELLNRLLQAEDMDLFTAVTLVNSASDCVKTLRTENEFSAPSICALLQPRSPRLCRRPTLVQAREDAQLTRTSADLQLKKQLVSHKVTDEKTEFKRLF
ncbi:hypothetical protein ABVT39_010907 [Epinephelus coioides]